MTKLTPLPRRKSVEECEQCKSPVRKMLTNPLNLKKNLNFGTQKPGNIVKQYIEDVKADITAEKERIASEEYEVK